MSLSAGTSLSCYHHQFTWLLTPRSEDSPQSSVLVKGFGFRIRQLGSNPPPTHSTWAILTLGKMINLSKSQYSHLDQTGNTTYLLRHLKGLNKVLYIQHQAQYLPLTKCSVTSDSYHNCYYSFFTPIISYSILPEFNKCLQNGLIWF